MDGTICNTMAVITARGLSPLSNGSSGNSKCLVTPLAKEVNQTYSLSFDQLVTSCYQLEGLLGDSLLSLVT